MDEPEAGEPGSDGLEVHRRFADSYLQQGGDGSRCDDEGLRHLAAHLYALRDLPAAYIIDGEGQPVIPECLPRSGGRLPAFVLEQNEQRV